MLPSRIQFQAAALLGLLFVGRAAAQETLDAEYGEAILANTTGPAYITEWVDHLPVSDTVPSPKEFLGYAIGDPGQLTHPDQILGYFEALAESSERLQLFEMGESHGGRRMVMAAIGDAALLARLDEIKAVNKRLSDPRVTSKAEAKALAASVPATYYITAGLHSPETGPPEMVMELAYRLIVSEAEHIQEIRKNVLTLLTPVLEMDGRARVVEWNRRYLQGIEDLGDMPPSSPPYWGSYTFHDNNRDGLQVSQPLTRNYNKAYHEYLPTVSLDLHESVPLLYISTGTGPYNETISPITVTEWQWMAAYDVSQATKLGLNGVWTWGFYTGWYPGYLLWVTNNHNAVGRFYETFGNSLPGTFERDLKRSSYASERVDSRQWYRPDPPARQLTWSLRNNTNFMQSGVLASLQLAARNGETLLFNYWQKGANSLAKGKTEAPYAYVIPSDQRDVLNLRHALWLFEEHRIEVHQAAEAGQFGEVALTEGDYVIRMDQPFRNFAKTLMDVQRFPADAEHTPYDDISWNLPLMLGLETHAVEQAAILEAPMEPVRGAWKDPSRTPVGMVAHASRTTFILDNQAQSGFASLVWALSEFKNIRFKCLTEALNGHPAGSLVVYDVPRAQMKFLGERYGIEPKSNNLALDAPLVDLTLPRVALFHTWTYTQDSGWARYTLEQLGIPFELIDKDDLRAGGLGERFDVILVPNTGSSDLKRLVHGIDSKWSPLPYTQTDEYPSHGIIDSTPDMTGGMGFVGLGHLESFVRAGGKLVTLGSAGILAADSGIASGVRSLPSPGTPGSHVSTKVLRAEHPSVFGYGERPHVFRGNLPLYSVSDRDLGRTVLQFGSRTLAEEEAEADRKAGAVVEASPSESAGDEAPKSKAPELCLSGLVPKPDDLERKAAILDVPVGAGHVILFGWNPLHRHQNHQDFAFVTNTLLYHGLLPGTPTEAEMRARE